MYYGSEHVSVTCIIVGLTCSDITCKRHMHYRLEHVSVTCIIGQKM